MYNLQKETPEKKAQKKKKRGMRKMTGKLGRKHPIWYDSYCLCEFSRDKKRETFSVVMLKELNAEILWDSFFPEDRKKSGS